MNKIILILSAVIFTINFTFESGDCFAQWTKCSGVYRNPGGNAKSITVNGNKIMVGTEDVGMVYSTDNGGHWNLSSMKESIYSMVPLENYLFAGTYGSGIFYSSDGGVNWNRTSLQNRTVYSLAVYQNKIYAASQDGLFVSSDMGLNWVRYSIGNDIIYSVAVKDGYIFAGTTTGLFVSTDEGVSWVHNISVATISSVAILGDRIFAGAHNQFSYSGLYVSNNNGSNWTLASSIGQQNIYSCFANDSNIYISSGSGVYFSTLSDTNWTKFTYPNFAVLSIAVNGNCLYAGTSRQGVFVSEDNGKKWKSSGWNTDICVNYLCAKGSKVFAGTDFGIFKSLDCGINWERISNPRFNSMIILDNKVFAADDSGIYVSDDDGGHWIQLNCFSTTMLSVSGNTIIAQTGIGWGYGCAFNFSFDKGVTWSAGFYRCAITGFSVADNDIYFESSQHPFAGNDFGLYHSGNCGVNWEKIPPPPGYADPVGIVGKENNIAFASIDKIYISYDKGATWSNSSIGSNITSFIMINDNFICVKASGGVIISKDKGNTWNNWNEGFEQLPAVNKLIVSGGYIYAGTEKNSVYRRTISNVTMISNEVPQSFTLSQNYPNPFNSETNFKFAIVKPGYIKLAIYDNAGREIEVLVSSELQPGSYAAHWDASKYSSGVYYCRLTSDGASDSKKMLLVK
jgi:photosystem II stability/assembly factor-like uncharacterized protein